MKESLIVLERIRKNTTTKITKLAKRIVKNGKDLKKKISCRLQFIDNTGFMAKSLLNLSDNIVEGIHKIK